MPMDGSLDQLTSLELGNLMMAKGPRRSQAIDLTNAKLEILHPQL